MFKYSQRLLEHLAHDSYRPATTKAVARDMRIDAEERDDFEATVAAMLREGKLVRNKHDELQLPKYGDEITGKFKLNPRGFGFVIPDEFYREGHLFIPPTEIADAVSGDRVRAAVVQQPWRRGGGKKSGRSETVGRIVEVLERGHSEYVGTLIKVGKEWMVEPDGSKLHDPVIVRDPHAKNAKLADKVVIELLHYPEKDYYGEGVIVKVLGEAGEPDVETEAVIAAHGLRTEFPEQAVAQARGAAQQFDDETSDTDLIAQRMDLRDDFVFTIDPPDAKDFDDAITIDYDSKEGEWTLGVHIADVSHFVKRGSALDEEAKARGNSVYLPRRVIPMLPEVLSNGVCSLQEGVPRFAKSVFITFDKRGVPLSHRLASTIINSRKRMTYLEAQALIDGDKKEARKHAKTEPVYEDALLDKLQLADRLAKTLEKRRKTDGMITLDLPEVELVFGDDGRVVDAVPEDDAYTHKLIEMFMVEANEALARTFDDLGVPILRRTHPEPAFGDMEELRVFAALAHMRIPDEPTRHDLQSLLNKTAGTPAARAIHFAVLRTLTKATYSPASVGHFALASDHYAHFTSPIRRYPDLTLHRVMQAFLDETDNGANVPGGKKRKQMGKALMNDDRVLDEAQLIELGRHCSDTEDAAEDAERDLRAFLVMQFLEENHLGDEFDGVITGSISRGVFVSIERYLVEGMVKLSDLPTADGKSDHWVESEKTGRFVAKRSGASIGLGDRVRVQIVSVNLAARQLDLAITEFVQQVNLGEREGGGGGPRKDSRRGRTDAPHAGRGKGKGKGKGRGKGKGKGRSKARGRR